MFPEPVSRTALLTAAARAVESQRADALFVDPYAERLAGDAGRDFHTRSAGTEARVASLAIRTRVFDDAILAAVAGGATQVVLPAAGMDTRAFRLDLPAHLRWFEIDHAAVLDHKARHLEGVAPRAARTAVPFDLRDAGVGAALAAAGFDRTQRTAVLVEGLLMYLPPPAVEPLLATFASLVPPGSTLSADLTNTACLDPAGVMAPFLTQLAATGAPWLFGTDDPRGVLARAGWTLDDVVYAGHPRVWPERMPFPAVDPPPPGYPVTWLVRASRVNGL